MTEEEEDKFIKENPIIFKKYKVKKKLGEGAFGDVYLGQTIENNQYVALKVEQRKIVKPILEAEAFLLYSIAGLGIPEVKSFGKVKNYNILVEPLLGKSLFDIFAENHKKMPIEDVCLIGKQVIDRIQWVHSKYIVHRDIKPDNFLIGKKDPNVIYLIDFGLSKKYRSSTTNKHIRFGFTGKLTGTVRFASANALRGGEQSRRDDIESIGYMLVYFLKQKLPWQGVQGNKKMERYLKIYKMKKNTTPEQLCGDFPEMVEYIDYAKKLEFEQEPDYNFLRKLFKRMLKRVHNTNDQLVFSWIKFTDVPNLKNPINPATRKDSPQSRIYKKIKSNLERERNLSSESDSKNGSYQQVMTQSIQPTSNIKVIDKNNNFTESEFEQKTEKNFNKRTLKAKEGLNTTIANLDATVDENVVDFENERLKKGSRDTGDYNNFINKGKTISQYNSNKYLDNTVSEKKNLSSITSEKNTINKENNINIPNNVNRNLNLEFHENANNSNTNNDINNNLYNLNNLNLEDNNKIKLISDNNYNIYPDDNVNQEPLDNQEKNNIIKKDNKEINNLKININNEFNNNINNEFNNDMNNKIDLNQNINNINSPNEKNILFDNTDNKINNLMNNKNKSSKINSAINKNVINDNPNNENSNISENIKSSNFDGKEFTFNEPIDFKSNISINTKKSQQIINNDSTNNAEMPNLVDENKKNDIYALLTGNDNYKKINNNTNNNKKINNNKGEQIIKQKSKNIDSIKNLEEINDYLRINNLDSNDINNNINSIPSKNRDNVNDILNIDKKNNSQIDQNSITQEQINNMKNLSVKKNPMIKRIKRPKKNNMNYKSQMNKENNNIDLNKSKNNGIKNNYNKNYLDVNKQISNELSNNTFPNDNDFGKNLMTTKNIKNENNEKLMNSAKKKKTQPMLNNEDFFNEFNNDLFEYDKIDNNDNEISNTASRKNKNMLHAKNNEIENNNRKYRGSNYNYGNNKNILNYAYLNNINIGNKPQKKVADKRTVKRNNMSKNIKNNNIINNINNNASDEGLKQKVNEGMYLNVSNIDKPNINNNEQDSNKKKIINSDNLQNIKGQNLEDKDIMNINYKNNYINKLGNNDNLINYQNNMIPKKNIINNSDANNGRILHLQTKRSPRNQQNINRGIIARNRQIISNSYRLQPQINNSFNNRTSLNQINNNINNNLNINLINSNINNRQQIYYQIPGYLTNNNINRQQYNLQYVNNGGKIQKQIVNVNPTIKQQKLIIITPNKNQTVVSGNMLQPIGIQYNKVIPNNINRFGNIRYNMVGNNNIQYSTVNKNTIYPYQQNKQYQVSLARK